MARAPGPKKATLPVTEPRKRRQGHHDAHDFPTFCSLRFGLFLLLHRRVRQRGRPRPAQRHGRRLLVGQRRHDDGRLEWHVGRSARLRGHAPFLRGNFGRVRLHETRLQLRSAGVHRHSRGVQYAQPSDVRLRAGLPLDARLRQLHVRRSSRGLRRAGAHRQLRRGPRQERMPQRRWMLGHAQAVLRLDGILGLRSRMLVRIALGFNSGLTHDARRTPRIAPRWRAARHAETVAAKA